MTRRFALVLLALSATACPASPRRFPGPQPLPGPANPGPSNPGPSNPTPGPSGTYDPRQALNQVDGYLQQQGYRRLGPAVRNPNLQANGVIAYSINGRRGACYTIVALAAPGANLDLLVLDPWGRTVAYNVDPDPHPWATTCAQADGRLLARLQMQGGAGEYFYVAYEGSPQVQPNLASLFGGSGAATGPRTATLDPGTANRVQALDQRLGPEGFRRVGEPQGLVLGAREERRFQLNLQAGTCYAFATFGGPGVSDTDAYLITGGGETLESDTASGVDALVRYCPQQAGAYQLRALVFGGQGALFTVAYAGAQAGSATPPSNGIISTTTTGGAGLEDNFRLLDADMRARGYESFGEPARGQLAEQQTRDFAISLEGGKCYAILAVGDNGVRDLDLLLLAGSRELDRDVEQDARPVVRICPESSGDFSMQVRMFSGQGNFVYAAYRWPRGIRGPFGLSGLIYLRLAEVTSLLSVEGYEPDVDATPGRGNLGRQGQSRTHDVQLAAGHCYSVLVVGGDGVHDLGVALKRGGSMVASDGSRNAFPSVRHCTSEAGRFSLEVSAESGSGGYFYQVFRRPE